MSSVSNTGTSITASLLQVYSALDIDESGMVSPKEMAIATGHDSDTPLVRQALATDLAVELVAPASAAAILEAGAGGQTETEIEMWSMRDAMNAYYKPLED